MAAERQVDGGAPGAEHYVVIVGDGDVEVVDVANEDVIEAWRGRAVAAARPFVAARVLGPVADVEYDLAHLDRRLAPWALELLDRHDGFHGSAYGMLRRVPRRDAVGVARHLASLVAGADSTVSIAASDRMRGSAGTSQSG